MKEWLNVGKIVNTHGVMGEVRVISITDFSDQRYVVGNKLYLFKNDEAPVELAIKTHRKHKQFDLLSFEGYEGMHTVEQMRDGILKIAKDELAPLAEDEFYFYEIIGCEIVTEDGESLGEVVEILTPGANDVWVVKARTGKDLLIPYIADVVKKIDIDNKKITIELLEGLLS